MSSSMMSHRRKATAKELEKGQRQMLQAQRRLERERMENGELALEDSAEAQAKSSEVTRNDSTQVQVSSKPKAVEDAAPSALAKASQELALPLIQSSPPPRSTTSGSQALQPVPGTAAALSPAVPKLISTPSSVTKQAPMGTFYPPKIQPMTPQSAEQPVVPLFDSEQLRRLQMLYTQAPLLAGVTIEQVPQQRSDPCFWNPTKIAFEELPKVPVQLSPQKLVVVQWMFSAWCHNFEKKINFYEVILSW